MSTTLKNPFEAWVSSFGGHKLQLPQVFPGAPATPDLQGIAQQQTDQNRIDQTNAHGSTVTFDPVTGAQTQSFGGQMGDLANSLQGQAAGAMGSAMDWSKFGALPTGDEARNQAIQSAWGHSTSRLDPMWDKREEASRTQLMNQGLDPGSEAYRSQMSDMGRDRNDAYAAALAGAIGQGTAAGDSVFRNSLAGRQQMVGESLTQRRQPMEDLLMMNGLLGQAGYNQSGDMLGAAMGQANLDMGRWQGQSQQQAELLSSIMSLLGVGAGIAGPKIGR